MYEDTHLEYSDKEFEEAIRRFNPAQKVKDLDHPPFASREHLLTFSKLAYKDSVGPEDLFPGWELLTTANNKNNGYHGSAFWNPDLQLVAVAHRGTQLTNTGALMVDMKGVFLNEYTSHMASALTFVHKIKTLLNNCNKNPGICFRLSLTGHSLGAWLAQVTAFTAMYIGMGRDGKFERTECGMLVHTLVFDSPGCKKMLLKMQDDFDKRCDGSMSIEKLDIEGYVIAANVVNTCNLHVGRVFLVGSDRTFSFIWNIIPLSVFTNITLHSLDKFVQAFQINGEVWLVADWPLGRKEMKNVHQQEKKMNSFNPEQIDGVRCEMELFFGVSNRFSVFSNEELYFLDIWNDVNVEKSRLKYIEDFLSEKGWGTMDNFLCDYTIDENKGIIKCTSAEDMNKLVSRTKQLFRWFPAEMEKLQKELQSRVPGLVYRLLDKTCRRQLPKLHYSCEDTLGLRTALCGDAKILCIGTDCTKFEAARILDILAQMNDSISQNSSHIEEECTFVNWNGVLDLNEVVHFEELLNNVEFTKDRLLVIDCDKNSKILSIIELLTNILKKIEKKVILIYQGLDIQNLEIFNDNPMVFLNLRQIFQLRDLTQDSRYSMLSRKVISIGGIKHSLGELSSTCNEERLTILMNMVLRKMMIDPNYFINIENTLPSPLDSDVLCPQVNQDVEEDSIKTILGREDILLIFSGEPVVFVADNLRYTEVDGEKEFRQTCISDARKTIYWIESLSKRFILKRVYNQDFYLKRKFHNRHIINIHKLMKEPNEDTFVINGIKDKDTLMTLLSLSKTQKELFINNLKIVIDQYEEISDDCVHYLRLEGKSLVWERSRGSLDGLHSSVAVDISQAIDEHTLSHQGRKVVIIADEPGMGKSTTLTSLALLIESAWVIRLDLKDAEEQIKLVKCNINLTSITEFLIPGIGKDLDRTLLKLCLESNNAMKVFLLFDGFDEIREDSNSEIKSVDVFLNLLFFLKEHTTARLIITTRKYLKEILENNLTELAIVFEDIGEETQREFLKLYWYRHLLLMCGEVDESWLETCADKLFLEAVHVLGPDIKSFMGIPLQLRMMAEVFLPRILSFKTCEEAFDDNLQIISVSDLYREFIDNRYGIFTKNKTKASSEYGEIYYNSIERNYRTLGCQVLDPEFTERYLMPFKEHKKNWNELKEMNKLGLIQTTCSGHFEFLHRTFAEFYFADLLIQWLRQEDPQYKYLPVEEIFLCKFLLRPDFKVVRVFLENNLKSAHILYKVHQLNHCKKSDFRDEQNHTALHIAVNEGNPGILKFLLQSLDPSQESVISFLATRDVTGRTILYAALETDRPDIIDPIINTLRGGVYNFQLKVLMATIFGYVQPRKNENKKIKIDFNFNLKNNIFENRYLNKLSASVQKRINTLINEVDNLIKYVIEYGNDSEKCCMEKLENDVERYYLPMGINSKGQTAINVAVDKLNTEMIEYFLNYDVLNSRDKKWRTPLICLVGAQYTFQNHSLPLPKSEYEKTLLKFISKGAQVNSVDKSKRTALSYGSENGKCFVVKALLDAGAEVYIQDNDRMTALSYAAARGYLDVVKVLLDHTTPNLFDCARALFEAAGGGHLKVVKCIMQMNVPFNSKGYYGERALFNAVERDHSNVVSWLCENGADVRLRDWFGKESLHYADRNLEIPRLLLRYGADVNCTDLNRKTPLMNAAQKDHLGLVQLLLFNGALVNSKDVRGETALSYALIYSEIRTIYLLLLHNAELTSMDTSMEKLNILRAVLEEKLEVITNYLSQSYFEDASSENFRTVMISLMIAVYLGQENMVVLFDKFLKNNYTSVAKILPGIAVVRNHEKIFNHIIQCLLEVMNGSLRASMICRVKGELEVYDYSLSYDNNINKEGTNAILTYAAKENHELLDMIVYVAQPIPAEIRLPLRDGCEVRCALKLAKGGEFRGIEDLVLLYLELACSSGIALLVAVRDGYWETMNRLIWDGVEVNLKDEDGKTPLHWATHMNNKDAVKKLLDAGADPFAKDNNGFVAEDIARQNKDMDIAMLIATAEQSKYHQN